VKIDLINQESLGYFGEILGHFGKKGKYLSKDDPANHISKKILWQSQFIDCNNFDV